MFDFLGARPRPRFAHEVASAPYRRLPRQSDITGVTGVTGAQPRPATAATPLPPSVARVAARTRLSAELLAALLAVDGRSRATLDDMERADALADALLARRRQRAGQAA
jgi:hypothetical protein